MDILSEIDEEEIAEVLSIWTGIPVFKLTEEETDKLLRMEDELHKRYVTQNEAVSAVSRAIRRTRSGLKDPRRPSGSFIFLGPSGVGKTELSKALAEFLFGDEDALIQLDMSEYMEKHTVSRLIGSPPGYVGYEEGGQLTEAVRRKPFSVILFDEIEKAHPDVFNTLLQILEDGRLTDSQGRTVDFKNTIIIMTSNLGTRDIAKGIGGIGFAFEKAGGTDSYDRMRGNVMEELKRQFRPEFLNRIDEVIVFHTLTQEDVKQIVDLMMKRVEEQLKSKDIDIELTDAARTLLALRGYDQTLGARPLRRTIQRLVEDPLAEKLLYKEFRAGETVIVDARRRRDHVRTRRGRHVPAGRAPGRARRLDRVEPGRDSRPKAGAAAPAFAHLEGDQRQLQRWIVERSARTVPVVTSLHPRGQIVDVRAEAAVRGVIDVRRSGAVGRPPSGSVAVTSRAPSPVGPCRADCWCSDNASLARPGTSGASNAIRVPSGDRPRRARPIARDRRGLPRAPHSDPLSVRRPGWTLLGHVVMRDARRRATLPSTVAVLFVRTHVVSNSRCIRAALDTRSSFRRATMRERRRTRALVRESLRFEPFDVDHEDAWLSRSCDRTRSGPVRRPPGYVALEPRA